MRVLSGVLAVLVMVLAGCGSPPPATPTDEAPPSLEPTVSPVEGLPTPEPTVGVPETPTEGPPETEAPGESPESPAEGTPPPGWTRERFGEAWDIAYPEDWTVNSAGAHEGAIQLEGPYEGRTYSIALSYPIGIAAESLDAWVEEQLAALSSEQRDAVEISDVTVVGVAAKKVLNMPADGEQLAHHVYIWRSDARNPSLIQVTQTDGDPVDPDAMEALLDTFIAQIR